MRLKVLLLLLAVVAPSAWAAPAPLTVTRITPEGDNVSPPRQIVIQFNRDVVPLGRMERDASELPIRVEPGLQCQWRWINPSALACQLDEKQAAKPATAYTLTVSPGITTQDGKTLDAPHTSRFSTQRPQVRQAYFNTWKSPGSPVIRAYFSLPVSRESVEKSLFIRVKQHGKAFRFKLRVWQDDAEGEQDKAARRVWLLQPLRELPLDTSVELAVLPGLSSPEGPLTGDEKRTVVAFDTFPAFEFLGISCKGQSDSITYFIAANGAEGNGSKCSPLKGAALAFSAPLSDAQVRDFVTSSPDLAGGRKDYDPWAGRSEEVSISQPHERGRRYYVWLPEILKARTTYHIASKEPELDWWERFLSFFRKTRASDLRDAFDRPLAHAFALSFETDRRPPNFVLANTRSVLEAGVDSEVPLYVTNLEKATLDFARLTQAGTAARQTHSPTISHNVQDLQFAVPLGVRDMLGGKSGVVAGTLTTEPQVSTTPTPFLAQVTPFAVHAKLGHFNSLVWVTDMATGKPVQNASITLYQAVEGDITAPVKALDKGKTGEDGLALLKGNEAIDPELSLNRWCYNLDCERLIVRVDTEDGMAFLPLNDDFQINSWRVSNYQVWESSTRRFGHIHSWGTTAQGIYRTGDTMQYKLFVRNQDNQNYTPPPLQTYTLTITDPLGNEVHKREKITLSAFGSFAGEYAIPAKAPMGWYEFNLSADFTSQYNWQPMRVLVTDFTPSPFKVTNSLNGDLFHKGGEVEVDTQAILHSGGAYTDAELRVTGSVQPRNFRSDHALARGFFFDTVTNGAEGGELFNRSEKIDDKGGNSSRFTLPETPVIYGRLSVESAVRDDRGKYVASEAQADYIAVDRLVGMKNDEWVYHAGKPANLQMVVVDERGNPQGGVKISVLVERLETKAARVKGAGNAYLTQYSEEWVKAGECMETSSAAIAVSCRFTPDMAGSYRATASIADTQGNLHSTSTQLWVTGKGNIIWQSKDDAALEIVPEKTSYAVGEQVNVLVKNPYPGAEALVTVERYGTIRKWVQKLEGSAPVISFPVEADFLPGFYLSVVVISPRVDAPPPVFGQIDLGKPAFRMGYAKISVQDQHNMLDVSVKTDAETYKPRSEVTLNLHVEPRSKDKQEPVEMAVAVLDESVLDLVQGRRDNFDPYKGFFSLDALDVTNFNLLRQLVGRQYFEKKGANPGGDGGADLAMRNNFKFVSYWNPSITPDAAGNATLRFTLPDNLTGWRVLAFAVTPSDRMGLGDASFKVNQPTEIRPVMPNQVTEGDRFRAGFSIMNRTDKERKLEVKLAAEGTLKGDKAYITETITLAPYKRQTVYLPVESALLPATRDVAEGSIRFTVSARDAEDGDATQHAIPVYKRRGLDTAAAYGTMTEAEAAQPVSFPANIHTDVGDVSVVLSPSVIGNVEGAFKYMRDYPYTCWEQKLTKGVMASHYQRLKAYMPPDFTWEESARLPQQILDEAAQFQAPNGGMSYFVAGNDYVSPYLSAYTALAFHWLKQAGYAIPQEAEQKLHAYLQNLLRQDTVPSFYNEGMTATVRAVALAALAVEGKLPLLDVQRFAPHMPRMSLFGKAHFLQAALAVKGGEAIARDTATAIYAASNQTGGKVLFNETLDDSYIRIHATPLRENCAVLSALSGYAVQPENRDFVGDTPFKMVRAITQSRGNRDHWENTQENLFCMQALADYATRYEAETPSMRITARLDAASIGNTAFTSLKDKAVTLSTAIAPDAPGKTQTVHITREGKGRLYYSTRLRYAPLEEHAEDVNAGIELHREYAVERNGKWELLDTKSEIKQGELVRVDLFLSIPAARNFVVVDDPVPGGLEPVNRDLATSSRVDADKGDFAPAGGSWWFKFSDWQHYGASRWNFYHREIGHKSVRFYSDYLPPGNYALSYTAQAVASGTFVRMPTHAEEMYDPDIYGKSTPGTLNVQP